MRLALAVVAVEAIEALRVRVTRRTHRSQTPLAEGAGHVPVLLEHLGDRQCIGGDRVLALDRLAVRILRRLVAADRDVTEVS